MAERKQKGQKWSAEVTKHSDALDLEADIFESDNPVPAKVCRAQPTAQVSAVSFGNVDANILHQ
jgi:hypothetical protein